MQLILYRARAWLGRTVVLLRWKLFLSDCSDGGCGVGERCSAAHDGDFAFFALVVCFCVCFSKTS